MAFNPPSTQGTPHEMRKKMPKPRILEPAWAFCGRGVLSGGVAGGKRRVPSAERRSCGDVAPARQQVVQLKDRAEDARGARRIKDLGRYAPFSRCHERLITAHERYATLVTDLDRSRARTLLCLPKSANEI